MSSAPANRSTCGIVYGCRWASCVSPASGAATIPSAITHAGNSLAFTALVFAKAARASAREGYFPAVSPSSSLTSIGAFSKPYVTMDFTSFSVEAALIVGYQPAIAMLCAADGSSLV